MKSLNSLKWLLSLFILLAGLSPLPSSLDETRDLSEGLKVDCKHLGFEALSLKSVLCLQARGIFSKKIIFSASNRAWASSVAAQKKGPAKEAKPNALEQFFPFILIGIGLYFVLIRPQQKRYRQHRDFLSKVKRGDEVLTSSGIYGKVEGLTEGFIILEVAKGIKIRVEKSHINSYALEDEKSQRGRSNK